MGMGRPLGRDRLLAAMERDRRAFDDLVAEHSNFLRSFLERRAPGDRVDDLFQDIWLAAWNALPSFDRRSGFQTWLCGIALNKVRDYYRRERRGSVELPLMEGARHLEIPDCARTVEIRDAVRSMVARLPDNQRDVIEMYYCCEYTLPEIARLTGRNLNTIKYQFYAAHAHLATILQGEKP